MRDDPVVIGGTGGSGTRVVARMLQAAGVFLGGRLNASDDALDLAEFDWTWGLDFLRDGATDEMRAAFEVALERHLAPLPAPEAQWGWKHPHAYLLLPFLAERFPALRFVHVVRDGRDIALADNQQQVGRYGQHALGPGDDEDVARRIAFWAWANDLAADQGEALLGGRYLRVRYEDLCARRRSSIRRLLAVAGADTDTDAEVFAAAVAEIDPPTTLGRGRSAPQEVRRILEDTAGPTLGRFGYRSTVTAAEREGPERLAPLLGERLGPAPERPDWPLVSIVVPTHDGRPRLERLLQGLAETTDHPAFELVVVDNASTDGTLEWLQAAQTPFPVTLLANHVNQSFSAACNRGAAEARGDLLLFLNDDVEPVEPGWLRRLTASLLEPGVAVSGAILVDPAARSRMGRTGAVQHDRLAFRAHQGSLRPVLDGLGLDVEDVLGPDRPAAAVAAACLLVRRSAFAGAGGFDEGYLYGGEDVDLCLRIRAAGGAVVTSGHTVLLHRPLSTRREAPELGRPVVRANRRRLLERWGPALRREYALEAAMPEEARRWRATGDTEDAWDAGVTYRILPADDEVAANAERLARRLRRLGVSASAGPVEGGALLDDVVVHLQREPHHSVLAPGRLDVLLHLGSEPPAPLEAARYDLVLDGRAKAEGLMAAVADELDRRGGPPRIDGAAAGGPGPVTTPGREGTIVVLGMSRTGTSATTRLLGLLGVELGDEDRLMSPNADVNARGFFEHDGIMRINRALLKRLGGRWSAPPPMPPGWHLEPGLDDLRERARTIVEEEFGTSRSWGFKDPRLSLTLPFWLELLDRPAFVVCHRNPLEVAASLAQRDGFDVAAGIGQWLHYTASAIVHTSGAPRLFLGFSEYFEDPDRALGALAGFAGRPDAPRDPAFRKRAEEWLEPGLRHHQCTLEDLLAHPAADRHVVELHLLLELAVSAREREPALAGGGGTGPISAALDAAARRILSVVAPTGETPVAGA